ncbi:MAG: DUF1727 domain-containing protein [Candidatus Levybacteria bacterium]|nr:DUF1727 domain-containing protein [Candidatus Levybacteria bacterium]
MIKTSVILGKSVSKASKVLKRSGSTWPGHVALKIDTNLISNILQLNPQLSIILVAGTNGKTTTTKLIEDVLVTQGQKVFRNDSGANLLNGITSTFIKHSNLNGKINYDTAVFEIDESSLPLLLSEFSSTQNKLSIILLNLFRDQLDRYGEVNGIAKKWLNSLQKLPKQTILITNGDDPMLRFIGENSNLHSFYFGLSEKLMSKMDTPHDVDFLFCPHCETELTYSKRSYSHMGIFKCSSCKFEHKKTATFDDLPNPMFGIYNKYNINAAALLLQKSYDMSEEQIKKTLVAFAPAFGRQEKIEYKGKHIFLLLSKNPTGFNQSIQAILEQDKTPNLLLLLNDRIPDGLDISWIWDVEFENLSNAKYITISGDRSFDMGLRIKYADIKNFEVIENLEQAIKTAVAKTSVTDTLYILSTYSAMLETRKILKGRSIL